LMAVSDVLILSSTHWYLAIICNLQHLERKLEGDTAANDSDSTMEEDISSADKIGSPPSGDQSSAIDLDTHTDKMDTSSDKEPEVLEASNSMENMSVGEEGGHQNEWPSEDEVERLDDGQERKNRGFRQLGNEDGVTDIPALSNTDEADLSGESSMKPKLTRRSTHYSPPNTYVEKCFYNPRF
jgi:hypothetical protein